jgi:NDP-sugar pyrophosphorylase family protein
MLDQALALARQHGHHKVLVNAHFLWEQVAAWCESRGVSLQVELPEILGTGGGLRAARDRLEDRVVVLNADILTDIDLSALLAAVPAGGAAMALGTDPAVAARAPVLADPSGTLVKLRDLVPEQPGGVPGTHFTGIHALDKDVLTLVPDGFACIVRSAYLDLVPARRVQTTRHAGLWVDIGTPAEYLRANLDVLAGRVKPPVDPWTRGTRGTGGCWIGEGVDLRGTAEASVLGDHAVVPEGAVLRRCVVWDGVTVPEGTHEDCILYDEGQVLAVR